VVVSENDQGQRRQSGMEFWSDEWTEFVRQHPILIGIIGILSLIALIAGIIWIVKTQRYR